MNVTTPEHHLEAEGLPLGARVRVTTTGVSGRITSAAYSLFTNVPTYTVDGVDGPVYADEVEQIELGR